MYIQPSREEREELTVPQGYSGNAFRQTEPPPPEAPPIEAEEAPNMKAEEAPPAAAEPLPPAEPPEEITEKKAEEAAPAGAFSSKGEGGLLSRLPLLSSLLPPKRGKKSGILPDWVLIAAVFFLFFTEEEETDILPFLLLLLLWD